MVRVYSSAKGWLSLGFGLGFRVYFSGLGFVVRV